jgi:hypothetical protein
VVLTFNLIFWGLQAGVFMVPRILRIRRNSKKNFTHYFLLKLLYFYARRRVDEMGGLNEELGTVVHFEKCSDSMIDFKSERQT